MFLSNKFHIFQGLKLLRNDLSTTTCPPIALETITDIESSCDTALTILNDLLSYEKLEAGLLQLEKSKFEAWPFIRESIKPFLIQVSDNIYFLTYSIYFLT